MALLIVLTSIYSYSYILENVFDLKAESVLSLL